MQTKMKRGFLYGMIILASFISVGHVAEGTDDYFEITKNLSIFGKVFRDANAYYVDEVDPTKVMRKGIDAMLESLDPYTNYISAGEIEDYRFISTGSYGGIGASVAEKDGHYIVTEAYEDDPAVVAGVKVGDEIVAIDNEVIQGKFKADIRTLLRGQAGSQVVLTIQRFGETATQKITVKRRDVKIENVPYFGMINDKTGFIALTGFTQEAGKEVRDALSDLKKNNPGMESVILDLRGNLGGLLHEAVSVLSAFLKKGQVVVETRGRMEGTQNKYPTIEAPVDTAMRIVVLVNGRSASASEIVAGAIQDLDRGVIVGTRSFGKGLVQATKDLNYNAKLKITTAKYLIPSGRCVQAIDYSRRYTDEAPGKAADSLRKPFKTRNNRVVYDVSGIDPEIEITQKKTKSITVELISQQIIFDFATEYYIKHPKIAEARKFKLSDTDYQDFIEFVRKKKFTYDTPAEKEIAKLKHLLEEENHLEPLRKEINEFKEKLKSTKEGELIQNKEEIAEAISAEIIKRYYYRRGMIESGFENDPYIKEALAILNNTAEYKKILSGK
ncbi:MAG: S41 family peptidase [Bacteroidia bacterium]|nr:S41 family peptidase [Bacteroidia bacterium]